jgi:hypothetical protein
LRQLSPTLTELSSQALDLGAARGGSVESRLEIHSRPQSSHGISATNEDLLMLDVSGDAETGLEAGFGNPSAPILDEANSLLTGYEISVVRDDPDHWTNRVAVRNIDVVLFQFCHISLPHQLPALRHCLGILLPHLTSSQAAENVHSLFVKEGLFLSTISLKEIESMWTNGPVISSNNEQEFVLRVLVRVHTFIRKVDWRIKRALICISCTQEAADCLSEVSQRPRVLPIGQERWIAQRSSSIDSAILSAKWPLRCFAASSAIDGVSLSLRCSSRNLNADCLVWFPAEQSILFESVEGGGEFAHCRRSRCVLQRGNPESVSSTTCQHSMETRHLMGKSVIGLTRSHRSPSEAQNFCLLLLRPLEYPYTASLVALLKHVSWSALTERQWTACSELEKSKLDDLHACCKYWVAEPKEEAEATAI